MSLGLLLGVDVDASPVDLIIARCCAAATLNPDAVAADRLEAWLRCFYAYFVSKQPIAAELLAHTEADDPVFGAGYARVIDAGRPLLAAAQDADGVNRALSLEQILDLVIAIAKIPGDDAHRIPILETALAALQRPDPRSQSRSHPPEHRLGGCPS